MVPAASTTPAWKELSEELVGGTQPSRDRVLTDEEIRKLRHAVSPHSPLLRCLLLTGQRISEAQRARWLQATSNTVFARSIATVLMSMVVLRLLLLPRTHVLQSGLRCAP